MSIGRKGAGDHDFRCAAHWWWEVLTAVVFAGMFTQLAFIGHDAGHRQIFRTRRANDLVGHVHGCLIGISYGWWVGNRRHHANPNHEDADPDIEIRAMAFTAEQARAKRGIVRWMAKYQAFLFFPLVTTFCSYVRAHPTTREGFW